MKKLFLAAIALTMTLGASARNNTTITFNNLPVVSQNFITSNFGTATIKKIKAGTAKYEVEFTNGTELEFYKNGSLKQAEAERQALPVSVLNSLPANVKTYVSSKFANWKLTDVEVKSSGKIEVELEKGKYDAELTFNQAGKLLKSEIDD